MKLDATSCDCDWCQLHRRTIVNGSETMAMGGEWYVWNEVIRHGYDSLLWGRIDGAPMPVLRATIREMLLVGRWRQ